MSEMSSRVSLNLAYILAAMVGSLGLIGYAIADIQVVSTFKIAAPSCNSGTGVPANGLCFKTPDGVGRAWNTANNYCNGLGGGYRLPTEAELVGLYNTYPNNQMKTVFGWPTDSRSFSGFGGPEFWSSRLVTTGYHSFVDLSSQYSFANPDSFLYHVTCVRPIT